MIIASLAVSTFVPQATAIRFYLPICVTFTLHNRVLLANSRITTYSAEALGADNTHGRPSSSCGRLEQHLGAVESVDGVVPSATPSAIISAVDLPTKSGDGGGGEGVREETRRRGNNKSIDGRIGARVGGQPGDGPSRALGVGSTSTSDVAIRRASDTTGQATSGRRRARDRKDGKRRSVEHAIPGSGGGVETAFRSSAAATVVNGAEVGGKGGTREREKGDGLERTQPRQRVGVQSSFGSSGVADSALGVGGACDDREGRRRGLRATNEGGRGGTEDRKFRMQAGQSNTLVAVRLRPLLKHDREQVEVAKVGGLIGTTALDFCQDL